MCYLQNVSPIFGVFKYTSSIFFQCNEYLGVFLGCVENITSEDTEKTFVKTKN